MVTIADDIDVPRAQTLQDAAYASLQGRAKSKSAQALVRAVCSQLAAYEGQHSSHQRKPGPAVEKAVGAFLADLLVAQSDEKPSRWVHRAACMPMGSQEDLWATAYSYAVLGALKGLGLVEHVRGVANFVKTGFGAAVTERRAARFRATPSLLELTARHRVPPKSAGRHFTFQYELPKLPLQARKANTVNAYTRNKVRGRLMSIVHTETSEKLEADVRELNEFLARQQIEGGVHQGYIRIFQNGDEEGFNWNYGGRLYSQPPATNYQQMSRRLASR